MQQPKIMLGVGNPIIDISALTDEPTLTKFGLEFGKTVFSDDQKKGFFDVLEASKDVEYISGGSVGNSIRVTNWMLNGSQDYKCHLLGCIGKDQYGTNLKNMLNKLDVTPILEEHATLNTSRCGVGIFQKERCLLPELNASPHLSLEFVKSHEETISKCEYLYVEGYFTKDCPEVIKYLIANFKARGKKVIFTLSATFMIEFFYDFIKDVADQADIIFCNREEAECFAKRKVETPIDEISLEMHKLLTPNANRLLVITCGSHPVSCSSYNREHQQLDFICHTNVWKITDDQIVDTNGCGDAFTGGFLSQYVQGKSIEHCLRAGNYASSVIIRNIGCTFPEKNDYKC